VSLPEQLLLSDLLRLRVRCDQGLDHGPGLQGWMHPPVHRLLGWASKPSAFGSRRLVWRLRGLTELEAMVQGAPAETDQNTLDRLPTLLEAALLGAEAQLLGTVADAAVELRTGRILHYLVSRSDPRLPGSSRWRLTPDRIVDQQPGQVKTALAGLEDLPLARASVRQELLRRSQVGQETSRLRDQFQQAGDRFEERLEGWLDEPPWDDPAAAAGPPRDTDRRDTDRRPQLDERQEWDGLDDWDEPQEPPPERSSRRAPSGSARPRGFEADPNGEDDPWI
jgi:hypothetical protein